MHPDAVYACVVWPAIVAVHLHKPPKPFKEAVGKPCEGMQYSL